MDNLLNTILKDTYTLTQFKKRLRLLQSYFQQKFFNAAQNEPLDLRDDLWLNSLPKSFLDGFNKNNLSEIMADLTNKINLMPVVTIFLGFEASEEILNQIGIKVRNLFGQGLILDIKYNPALIAGCSLSWKGIYRDYSLHSRIIERKLPILQSFKRFLR